MSLKFGKMRRLRGEQKAVELVKKEKELNEIGACKLDFCARLKQHRQSK
jgi:hypothetical protein